MARKRLTQFFPFLLPLRIWQRNLFERIKMRFDKNRYACRFGENEENVKYEICAAKTAVINENSGMDIIYQQNKIHNLKITSKTMNRILIYPGETFSFCFLSRNSHRYGRMKDGLILVDGNLTVQKGGGTCHLSNLLYGLFLISPLTVTERHGHGVKSFPDPDGSELDGIDATICEGWLDLKAKNETDGIYQIEITFDDKYMYGRILSDTESDTTYSILNENVRYKRENGELYKYFSVSRTSTDKKSGRLTKKEKLYDERLLIGYELPAGAFAPDKNKKETAD